MTDDQDPAALTRARDILLAGGCVGDALRLAAKCGPTGQGLALRLACDAADRVLPIFEAIRPNDSSHRECLGLVQKSLDSKLPLSEALRGAKRAAFRVMLDVRDASKAGRADNPALSAGKFASLAVCSVVEAVTSKDGEHILPDCLSVLDFSAFAAAAAVPYTGDGKSFFVAREATNAAERDWQRQRLITLLTESDDAQKP